MYLFATIVVLTAPTIAVLLWLSLRFASSANQRLTNLVFGFLAAVGSVLGMILFFDPAPNTWADANYGLLFFAVAPVGSALGVAVATVFRYCRYNSW